MKEAHDHHRVSPEGRACGEWMAQIATEQIAILAIEGEHVECCKTCAFRPGTVPNGCAQTQSDVLKAVLEGVPFLCHQNKGDVCAGWFAARQDPRVKGRVIPCDWEFSPPD